ncbi:MAG: phosphoribosyltransferase family protein [Actinomycetes bacterium]
MDIDDEATTTAEARRLLLEHFRWTQGHGDVWRVFSDAAAWSATVSGLVGPWRDKRVTHVAGVESRGFLLGGAAAIALGVGFVAIRKADGLFPGAKVTAEASTDYRGLRHQLRMQRTLGADDRVLIVDDWAEVGSQAQAARQLIESVGATFAGLSLMVDQMSDDTRGRLAPVTSLVRADELGDPDAR